MSNSTKKFTELDPQQTLQASFNDADASLTTSGFLTGIVGRKITQTISTTSVAGDTATFSFYENLTTLLYTIQIIYTDSSQSTMISATRTA